MYSQFLGEGGGGNGQENLFLRHVCFFTCHPCIIGIPKINESKLFFCSVLLDLLKASVGFHKRRLLLSQQILRAWSSEDVKVQALDMKSIQGLEPQIMLKGLLHFSIDF